MAHTAIHDTGFHDRPSRSTHANDYPARERGNPEFAEHLRTYRGFVKGVMLFAGHVLIILVLLYYFLM